MDLSPYVEQIRRELAVAAEAGGDDARALAERLTAPLASATRLTLLDALSAAAEEITSELAPGSVDVRIRGGNPDFVVTAPRASQGSPEAHLEEEWSRGLLDTINSWMRPPPPPPPAPPSAPDAEEGGTSRITLRLPEHLKPRIEEAANREGLSVNSWLVRAVAAALEPPPARDRPEPPRGGGRSGQHYTGWVR